MFFTRTVDGRHTLMTMKQAGKTWTNPVTASFSGEFVDVDPFIAADGKRPYFSSKRPISGTVPKDSDLCYAEVIENVKPKGIKK